MHLWQLQPVRDCLWIAIAVFLLWASYKLRSIFTPVLIALGRFVQREFGQSDEQLGALTDELQAKPLNALGTVVSGTSRAFGFVGNMVSATTYFIVSTLLIPIYFFMFSWRFHPMLRNLDRYVPAGQHDRILGIVRQMDVLRGRSGRRRCGPGAMDLGPGGADGRLSPGARSS